MMNIRVGLTTLRLSRWYEYVIRFVLGGIATVITGVVAKEFGPTIGGLFLAFPAVLPASTTLIQTHEKKRKHRLGLHGEDRGRQVAGLDAAGAAMGSFGMVAFAVLAWVLLPRWPTWAVLVISTVVWFAVSIFVWRQRRLRKRLMKPRHAAVPSHR